MHCKKPIHSVFSGDFGFFKKLPHPICDKVVLIMGPDNSRVLEGGAGCIEHIFVVARRSSTLVLTLPSPFTVGDICK